MATLLLLLWAGWLVLAQVPVYEVGASARIERERAIHPVAAPTGGRIVESRLRLGATVTEGDILVELDPASERLLLAEEEAQLLALQPEIEALDRQLSADEAALAAARSAAVARKREAEARLAEATAAATLAGQDLARMERLRDDGQLAEADLGRARNEQQRLLAARDSAERAVERAEREGVATSSDRQSQIERLRGEKVRLEGQATTLAAKIAGQRHRVLDRGIRAPRSGTLADVTDRGIGAVVQEGEQLAVVIAPGALSAVALFPPTAVGRVRPGQAARLRLEGFVWSQYGTVQATVRHVASEIRDGRVRVELDLQAGPESAIPLQHGLTGTAEVLVETISPAALVLRAAGRLAARPTGHDG